MSEVWFYGSGNTSCLACEMLVANELFKVRVFALNGDPLISKARDLGVPLESTNKHHPQAESLTQPELIISFLFPRKIPTQLIRRALYGGINFHPAPLPHYRGVHCAAFAILNREDKYSVTCHFMTEFFDDGPILAQKNCPILPDDTEISLESRAKESLFTLFSEVLTGMLWRRVSRTSIPWPSRGRLYTKRMYETAHIVKSIEMVDLELWARAFWHPPTSAAIREDNGIRHFLIPKNHDIACLNISLT